MPRPNSKSSSVRLSSTYRTEIQSPHSQEQRKQAAKGPLVPKFYLAAFDVFRAGSNVHGHSHDNLQPGLDCTCPPHWHACVSGKLCLLEAVQLLLSVRQALLCKAVRVWVDQIMVWHTGIQGQRNIHSKKKPTWQIWRRTDSKIGVSASKNTPPHQFVTIQSKNVCFSNVSESGFLFLPISG